MNQNSIQLPTDSFSDEIRACWRLLPSKTLFFSLLGLWLAFFWFFGNPALGFIKSPSLFAWMIGAYNNQTVNADDGHGNVIPFLVLGLMWWKRKVLLSQPMKLSAPCLILIAGALFIHVLGYIVQQQRLSIVGLFLGIYGLTGLVWGPRWLRASFFPFFLFVFMVPLGSLTETVTFPLRILVSAIVQHFFSDILGIGVLRQGTQLLNGMGTFHYEVEAACSGIRSLTAIFLASIAYGFVAFDKPWKRFAMVAASLPLAVLGNAVRLGSIVAAGELSSQETGKFVHDSSFFSMLPYIPAFIGMVYIARWLEGQPSKPSLAKIPTQETKNA